MFRSIPRHLGAILGAAALATACSATGGNHAFTTSAGAAAGGSSGQGSGAGQGGNNAGTASTGQGGTPNFSSGVGTSMTNSTGSGTNCTVVNMDDDMDGDGWTPNQGDCNDCDKNVNPGAVDVPGDPNMVDNDCSGTYDPPTPCDTGLALDDVAAGDGAKAIELCQTTTAAATGKMKTWGVLTSNYVRANGTTFAPGVQVGLLSNFGPNTHVQAGQTLLALSSGHARITGQPDACTSDSCAENKGVKPPTGFPQDVPGCEGGTKINDDVGLEVTIRVPTNATGYKFQFKFNSFEYPDYVCTEFNDQFIALANPAPAGAINGNISFDSKNNPVSVNLAFFTTCDPTNSASYACVCGQESATCPAQPSPFCPSGSAELQGTGFDIYGGGDGACFNGNPSTYGGATAWLETQAPVAGGETLDLRFAIWDTGDQELDSTVLLDNFQWIATPGTTVSVMTTPLPQPQ
jgi:hypothetical protein